MLIGTKGMLTDENGEKLLPNFIIDGEGTYSTKSSTKYLGVKIDNQLKYKDLKYHLKLCVQ